MKSMGLPTVHWNADSQQWFITPANSEQAIELDYWASQQPDLEVVDLQLAATNYACHWVDLPGVKQRMVAQAIPFALEDLMIDDVSQYKVIHPSSQQSLHQAYLANTDLIQSLTDLMELHHLQLRSLVPETARLADDNAIIRHYDGWLIKLANLFEGWLPDAALLPTLDALIQTANDLQIDGLVIYADKRDLALLAQTNLDTSFPEVFTNSVVVTDSPASQSVGGKYSLVNMNAVASSATKAPRWWGGLAAVAATWLVLAIAGLFIDNQIKAQQITEVRSQSVSLYKQWFPGERVRFLSRQFNEKLSGETSTSGGLLPLLSSLSQAYQQPSIAGKLTLVSLRYSDRIDEVTIEVVAQTMPVLQELKVFIEQAGLQADIASATNDGDSVKGRVRIGVPA